MFGLHQNYDTIEKIELVFVFVVNTHGIKTTQFSDSETTPSNVHYLIVYNDVIIPYHLKKVVNSKNISRHPSIFALPLLTHNQ